jgi:hypothetical protein
MSKFQKQVEEMREGLDIFRNNKKYPFFVKEGPGGLWFTVKYTGSAPPPGNRESWFSYMADILDYNSGYSVNYVSDRELKLKHSQEIWDRTSKRMDLKWKRIWHQNPRKIQTHSPQWKHVRAEKTCSMCHGKGQIEKGGYRHHEESYFIPCPKCDTQGSLYGKKSHGKSSYAVVKKGDAARRRHRESAWMGEPNWEDFRKNPDTPQEIKRIFASDPRITRIVEYLDGWVPMSYRWPARGKYNVYTRDGTTQTGEYDRKRSGGRGPRLVGSIDKSDGTGRV